MRTELLDFELPPELIASRPPEARDGGRLCVVLEGGVRHARVPDLTEEIGPGDLVVLNETRVRRARLRVQRPRTPGGGGGAQAELLFLHPAGARRWAALGRANKPLRVGDVLEGPGFSFTVVDKGAEGVLFVETDADVEDVLGREGEMPIPPYFERRGDEDDVERYQTVFARHLGSAAAPTAGLHLTEEILGRLEARGARLGRLTLHVGIGTFRPVSTEDLDDHPMHEEWFETSEELAAQVRETRARGGRVVAVGTTVVRALESAASSEAPGEVRVTRESTRILIQPGHSFRVVDALLTNFHMPKSTLLALVSAFVGRDRVLHAYQEAVRERYRFLSYGDAMWIPGRLS